MKLYRLDCPENVVAETLDDLAARAGKGEYRALVVVAVGEEDVVTSATAVPEDANIYELIGLLEAVKTRLLIERDQRVSMAVERVANEL